MAASVAIVVIVLVVTLIVTVICSALPSNARHGKGSVQIVVLGDLGHSPRMQYHALSVAKNNGHVDFIGYLGSYTTR